jgi:acyl-CoA reductase-like NAD-dependent aldehyde dehydrogenase
VEVIAEVAAGTAEDVDNAVRVARDAFQQGPWPRMSARDRGRLLFRLADLIQQDAAELVALETLDNGKPIRDAQTIDVPSVVETFRYYGGFADKLCGQTIPMPGNFFTYTRREPVGVAGQIIPWNFPMLMVAWKWAPAFAAGIWTRDVKKAHYLAAKIRAGTVWIKCYDVLDPAAPFGGFKMSGIGRELGQPGLEAYTELKTVTMGLDQ